MKKFKISIPVRSLVLSISVLISFVIFLILNGVSSKLGNDLLSQQMAERWSDEKDVSQISCFFSRNAGVSEESIEYFRHSLDSALMVAMLEFGSLAQIGLKQTDVLANYPLNDTYRAKLTQYAWPN